MYYEEWLGVLTRLLAATFCGGLLGWEREVHDKPAGLRTNMLVGMGAAAATISALMLYHELALERPDDINADPIRIISGVIGGIGFLGAGAIIQSRGHVEGVTTAATIWVVGGIGVACGLAYYSVALISAVTAFLILYGIGRFEHRLIKTKPLVPDENAAAVEPPRGYP